jgi:DNA polymerase I
MRDAKVFVLSGSYLGLDRRLSMKVCFWLLDVNQEVKDHVGEVWLWGVDDAGKRLLVIDRSLVGYFYAVVLENTDAVRVADKINKQQYPYVVKTEVVDRKFFGKPVKAVKIYCQDPGFVGKYAKELRGFEGVKDCLEDDVRYSMRYLIDNDVVPCAWHEVDVVEEKNTLNVQVDKMFTAKSPPKMLERAEVPRLRILGFSTVYYSREGAPKADRNPIVIISCATNRGDKQQFLASEDKDDKSVVEEFVKYLRDFDPDVVVGYGVNDQHWPYLLERCRRLKLRLTVDRAETVPRTSVYGHVSLTGRANVDIADFADEFLEVKVKTLENLAGFLGVMRVEDRTIVEDVDFADYWDSKQKREVLKRFSAENTERVVGIADAVLDFGMQLSSLVSLPLDHVVTAAAGFRVEWFLIKRTHKLGELAPKRVEQPYRPYAGGLVLTPKPGLHENVAVLDFKSMYPNLMITYNISPDTYVSPNDPVPAGGVFEAPEVKHRFRKEPSGFYKEALSYLIRVRGEIRRRMKGVHAGSLEFRVLDARQKAVKVITNASYGYAGWVGARWYVKPVAEAAAAWGRSTIMTAVEMAEKEGLKVIYGDTDSIFLENEAGKVEKLSADISKRLGLEVSVDEVFVRVFFTEAKKRYAGLLADGRLDVVGLEVVRGDWAAVAKNVQEKVLEIILNGQSAERAVDFVHQFVSELRQRKVGYRDLVIWKTLTKPVGEYEVRASHVEAAKMLEAKGWKLDVGDKVGYVVVKGEGRLYGKVKPYVFASYDDVDLEYYVAKQVVPAAARILESFGISEEQLLESGKAGKKSRSLTEFFG